MTPTIHPLSNLALAGQYLSQLKPQDISNKYFQGIQKYQSTLWNRFNFFFNITSTLTQLNKFYPHVKIISQTIKSYTEQKKQAFKNGLIITGISWFVLFQMARRGYVLPLFKQYGSYFKTHRLFRHYACSLFLPTSFLVGSVNWLFLNHTQNLWAIHARRMNAKMTQDPEDSTYPPELLPISFVNIWMPSYIQYPDMKIKLQNQQSLLEIPDYQEPQFQAEDVVELFVGEEQEEDQEDQDEEEEDEEDQGQSEEEEAKDEEESEDNDKGQGQQNKQIEQVEQNDEQ